MFTLITALPRFCVGVTFHDDVTFPQHFNRAPCAFVCVVRSNLDCSGKVSDAAFDVVVRKLIASECWHNDLHRNNIGWNALLRRFEAFDLERGTVAPKPSGEVPERTLFFHRWYASSVASRNNFQIQALMRRVKTVCGLDKTHQYFADFYLQGTFLEHSFDELSFLTGPGPNVWMYDAFIRCSCFMKQLSNLVILCPSLSQQIAFSAALKNMRESGVCHVTYLPSSAKSTCFIVLILFKLFPHLRCVPAFNHGAADWTGDPLTVSEFGDIAVGHDPTTGEMVNVYCRGKDNQQVLRARIRVLVPGIQIFGRCEEMRDRAVALEHWGAMRNDRNGTGAVINHDAVAASTEEEQLALARLLLQREGFEII